MSTKKEHNYVVFYDGECGFCSASVQFILNHWKKPIYFSPLQAGLSKQLLDEFDVEIKLDTIYYLKNGKLYDRSSAVLQIARRLKGGYPLLFALYIIPKFIRDPFYTLVAKNRNKIKPQACMLPTPEERKYFLNT